MNQIIQKLKRRIINAYLSDPKELPYEELEKEVCAIENDINSLDNQNYKENDDYKEVLTGINELRKAVRKTKRERFIYDEDIERDLMDLDRHDEDSMYDD